MARKNSSSDPPSGVAGADAVGLDTDAASLVIRGRGVAKTYGAVEAVRGIDFQVGAGRCVGLLGPNGAGKTTTMRMIMGTTTVSAGELTVFGIPVADLGRKEKARIGLVPQDDNLDPDLSVRQNLEVYGRYFSLTSKVIAERIPPLLDFMQLSDRVEFSVNALSGGMKRRLIIARALVANPELVILDEPTTGLDPQARVMIWKQLIQLRSHGKTLLLTTHYMEEAERLCDEIIVIDHGHILDRGSPATLIDRHVKGHVFELQKPLPHGFADGRWEREDIGDAVLYYVETPRAFAQGLPDEVIYRHRQANLEDVFLRLTGRQLRET